MSAPEATRAGRASVAARPHVRVGLRRTLRHGRLRRQGGAGSVHAAARGDAVRVGPSHGVRYGRAVHAPLRVRRVLSVGLRVPGAVLGLPGRGLEPAPVLPRQRALSGPFRARGQPHARGHVARGGMADRGRLHLRPHLSQLPGHPDRGGDGHRPEPLPHPAPRLAGDRRLWPDPLQPLRAVPRGGCGLLPRSSARAWPSPCGSTPATTR